MTFTSVRFTDPISNPWFIFSYYFNGIITASSINNKIFEVRIVLQKDGSYCFFYKLPLIIAWSNNAYKRPFITVRLERRDSLAFFGPGPARLVRRRYRELVKHLDEVPNERQKTKVKRQK
jgi:hypothetical protein